MLKRIDAEALTDALNRAGIEPDALALFVYDGKNQTAAAVELAEHGETTVVTAKGEGFKVKFGAEFLLKQK